ncbi:MAG: hypothetical protein QXV75_08505 [Candidatus Bathyarchaeia archaeon]
MRYVIVCYSERSAKALKKVLEKVKEEEEKIADVSTEDNVVVIDTEGLEEFEEEEETF